MPLHAQPTISASRAHEQLPLEVVERTPQLDRSGPGTLRKKVPLMICTALLVGVCWYGCLQLSGAAGDTESSIVSPGSAGTDVVFALGILEPTSEVIRVAAPYGAGEARVDRVAVRELDRVQHNAVLAVLDNERSLQAAVTVARTQLAIEQAKLEQTRNNVRSTVEELDAQVRSAGVVVTTANTDYERSRQLLKSQATSRAAFDDAKLALDTAEETLSETRARRNRYSAKIEGEAIDVVVARRSVEVAAARLTQALADQERAYIRAPLAGTILDLELRPGERVGQSTLLSMGATDSMQVRAEVYESDVRQITVGDLARITASALPGTLQGTVHHVGHLVRRQSVVNSEPAANTDARVVEVRIQLDESSSELASHFVNLQVRVRIEPAPDSSRHPTANRSIQVQKTRPAVAQPGGKR